MTLAVGLNHPMGDASTARWGLLAQIGCKGLRLSDQLSPVGSAGAAMNKAASLGIRCWPIIYDTSADGAKNWWNTHHANAGFASFLTFGNEDYFREGGASYIGRWKTPIEHLHAVFPDAKVAIQGVWKDHQSWITDIVNTVGKPWLQQHVWAWELHPYSTTDGGAIDPTADAYGAAFNGINNFINNTSQGLKHFGLEGQFIICTEWGFLDTGAGGRYGTTGQAQQADYTKKEYDVFRSFPTVVLSAQFELEDNPGGSPSPQETRLGVVAANSSNWTISSAPDSQKKQAWAVVQAQCAGSGSFDFSGTTGGGGGGGGGGTFDQVTLARSVDQHSVVASNVDANAVTLKFAATAADDANDVTYYTVPVASDPQTFTPPDYTKPFFNVSQYDSTGQLIGTWFVTAGTGRVQVFPAASDIPDVTTNAADAITTDGATLHATVNLGNQVQGTGRFDVADDSGFTTNKSTTPPVSVSASGGTVTTPALVAASKSPGGNGNQVVPNPGTPGAGQNGHKILAKVVSKGNWAASAITPPSTSWQPVSLMPSGGGPAVDHQDFANAGGTGIHRLAFYLLTCGSAEPANYTWTVADQGQGCDVLLFEWDSNFDHVDPSSQFLVSASGQAFTVPSGQAVANHDVMVAVSAFANGEAQNPPSGFTEPANGDVQSAATTSGIGLEASYKAVTADGQVPTGTVASTNGNATGADTACTALLILKPKAAGSTATFSWLLTGRGPGKVTYVRALFDDAGGSDVGSSVSFTTAAGSAPPTVSSGSASGVGSTTATITFHVKPNGGDTTVGLHVQGGAFQYDAPTQLVSSERDVVFPLSNLPPGTPFVATPSASNVEGDAAVNPIPFTTGGGQITQGGRVKILAPRPLSMAGKIGTALWPDADGTGWFVVVKGGFGHEFQTGQLEAV